MTANQGTGPQPAHRIINEIRKLIHGKDAVIEQVMIAVLARGHILLEDIPGVGKTTLAIAFSKATQLKYNRIQFTPDVVPGDVTGYTMYQKSDDRFVFVPGAVMCNFLLADEINRTSSRTQSALLQVMEEGTVTVEQKTYRCPDPFIVMATQNPFGYAGTQKLPESQLDRFLVRVSMGYPDEANEVSMLRAKRTAEEVQVLPVATQEDVLAMQAETDRVYVHDHILMYITRISAQTRNHPSIALGLSPRGSIAIMRAAKAHAFLHDRMYVVPQDVMQVLPCAMHHRLVLKAGVSPSKETYDAILADIYRNVAPPQIEVPEALR